MLSGEKHFVPPGRSMTAAFVKIEVSGGGIDEEKG
jgi:hypothetical protein